MPTIELPIAISRTGGVAVDFTVTVPGNLIFHLITFRGEKSFDQDEFMGMVSKTVFETYPTWPVGKKMAVIKYFRKAGYHASPVERGVMIDNLYQIMKTAAERYDAYCHNRTAHSN